MAFASETDLGFDTSGIERVCVKVVKEAKRYTKGAYDFLCSSYVAPNERRIMVETSDCRDTALEVVPTSLLCLIRDTVVGILSLVKERQAHETNEARASLP